LAGGAPLGPGEGSRVAIDAVGETACFECESGASEVDLVLADSPAWMAGWLMGTFGAIWSLSGLLLGGAIEVLTELIGLRLLLARPEIVVDVLFW